DRAGAQAGVRGHGRRAHRQGDRRQAGPRRPRRRPGRDVAVGAVDQPAARPRQARHVRPRRRRRGAPMSRPRRSFGQQPGRLVATMLRALAAELSEPGRYARGKAYARDDAVIEIDIRPEVVTGLVLGSRREPYSVTLAADPVAAEEIDAAVPESVSSMTMLIPGRDELAVSCSCPDAVGALCKHAIALLLVFADETSIEPELLVRWRSEDPEREGARPALQRMAPRGRVIDAA